NVRAAEAPSSHWRRTRYPDREAQYGPHHSVASKAANGAGAERVLPQREDKGDSKGTGPRREERIRRTQEKDRIRRHAKGCARQSHTGTEKTGRHAAHVRRLHSFRQL